MPSTSTHGSASLLIRDPAFKLLAGRPRPEFIVAGAAKCGTTSFSSYLPRHPQVRECIPKEPNFWSWRLCDRAHYQSLFVNPDPLERPRNSQQVGGEYSTSYLLHPLAPRRLAARLPGVRVIVLLRNPVDRAYSHYVMARREQGGHYPSFEQVIEQEIADTLPLLQAHQRGFLDPDFRTACHRCGPDGRPLSVASHDGSRYPLDSERALMRYYVTSLVFRSVYHEQLWRWTRFFPARQLLIIDSDRLLRERLAVMAEAAEFLGLREHSYAPGELDHTWGGGSNEHNRPGDYPPMALRTRQRLEKFFQPYNHRLYELLGRDFNWD